MIPKGGHLRLTFRFVSGLVPQGSSYVTASAVRDGGLRMTVRPALSQAVGNLRGRVQN
jgi:hypothetical protein